MWKWRAEKQATDRARGRSLHARWLAALLITAGIGTPAAVHAQQLVLYENLIGFEENFNMPVSLDSDANLGLGGEGRSGKITLIRSDGVVAGMLELGSVTLGTKSPGPGLPGTTGRLTINPSIGSTSTLEFDGDIGRLILGSQAASGVLALRSNNLDVNVLADGNTGTILNAINGNGLVKAWAKLAADGTLVACYECSETGTGKTALGTYEINFAPMAANIRSRPRTAVLDTHGDSVALGFIGLGNVRDETYKVRVLTGDTSGGGVDRAFTVLIY